MGWLSHILWKIKHVPNHQPDNDNPKNIQDHPRPLKTQWQLRSGAASSLVHPPTVRPKKTIQVQLTRNTKKVNLNLTIFQQTYATRRLNRCQPQSNFNRLEIVSIDDSVVHEGWPKTTGWQNHPIGILVNSPAIRGLPKKTKQGHNEKITTC